MNAVRWVINLARKSSASKSAFHLHTFCRFNAVQSAGSASRRSTSFRRIISTFGLESHGAISLCTGSFQSEKQLLLHDLERAVELIPSRFRTAVFEHEEYLELIELVMDYGRQPLARFPTGNFKLSKELVNEEDLKDAILLVGTFDDSNRAGLKGTLHRISCIRDRDFRIYGLTIRIGRAATSETAGLVQKPLLQGRSILLIGVGKTSAIRNICKVLSVNYKRNVMIVDTSSEIAGPGWTPHIAVGECRRMLVRRRSAQFVEMKEAVQNHSSQVVIIDEIGSKEDCCAAKYISQRGVQLLATTHGRSLEDLIKDRMLRELVGGVKDVIIGDKRASGSKMKKKIIQERVEASSFDVVVEMADRTRWRIHYDANSAVDAILAGSSPGAEVRYLDENGKMVEGRMKTTNSEDNDELIFKIKNHKYAENQPDSKPQSSAGLADVSIASPTSDALDSFANTSHTTSKKQESLNSKRGVAMSEAARIVNASSDLDVLQVTKKASRGELRERYRLLHERLPKISNEEGIMRTARHRLLTAYTRCRAFKS